MGLFQKTKQEEGHPGEPSGSERYGRQSAGAHDRDGHDHVTDGREDFRDQDALQRYHPFPQWVAGNGSADSEVNCSGHTMKVQRHHIILMPLHFFPKKTSILWDFFVTLSIEQIVTRPKFNTL